MAVTYEGFCRMRTDGTRCMIFSSFKDTVHVRLSDTGSRTIDIVAWPCLPRPFQSLSPYGKVPKTVYLTFLMG